MDFKIPKKVQIGGVEISVKYRPQIENIPSRMGQCNLVSGEILIADRVNGLIQSDSAKRNTFFHELTHCILDTMGEDELSQNEKFVCTFSSFLTGAIESMEE